MTDRDRFELEMSPGMQPPTGLGDRVLVVLALLVLIGGAVIAVGKVLPDPNQVAQGSAAPSSGPDKTPRPLPTPKPPRVATLQDPHAPLPSAQYSYGSDIWIRALTDLVVRRNPNLEAGEVGTVAQGEILYASQQTQSPDEPGWLWIQEPEGWIATIRGGEQLVRRYEYPQYQNSGWVDRIATGPDGFVAMVTPPGLSTRYQVNLPAASRDGATWQLADPGPFENWNGGPIAWGPTGWLVVGYGGNSGGEVWVWSSSDGLRWTRPAILDGMKGESASQLVASKNSYLLETYPERGGYSSDATLWSSPDGVTWLESKDAVADSQIRGERRLAGFADGFYMWDSPYDPAVPTTFGAYSPDGQTWTEVEGGPDGINLQLIEFQGRIVAIDVDPATLDTRVWSAALGNAGLSWARLPASDQAFAGGVARQLVSDGIRVFAFGWDVATDEPLVWTGNGVHWVRSRLPEAIGGIPSAVGAGPAGVVVVGRRSNLRGDNPTFWHRTASGHWASEPDPVVEFVPNPAGDACPELPNEILEFSVVDAAAVISCYGATPITFRAFSVPCTDCTGLMPGNPTPAWLVNPQANQLFLAPKESLGDWLSTVALAPSLTPPDPDWTGTWLEITGHFDDPASPTCRAQPSPDQIPWWSGRASFIDQCRRTFVVTAVAVVSGP